MNTPGYYALNEGDVISAAFNHSYSDGAAFCRWLMIKYLVRCGRKDNVVLELNKVIDLAQRWQEEYHTIEEMKEHGNERTSLH